MKYHKSILHETYLVIILELYLIIVGLQGKVG